VDEWRFFRNGFNLIHCSLVDKRSDILKTMPLPFDYELIQEEDTEDLVVVYNKLRQQQIPNA
jgi:hypothetical protein